MNRVPRLTSRGVVVLIAASALITGGLLSGITDIARAGLFAATLMLGAFVLAATRTVDVTVRRTTALENRLESTRDEEVSLSLSTRSGTQLPVEISDPHTFGSPNPRWSHPRLARGETRLRYIVQPQHRGTFKAGPSHIDLCDPWSLAYKRISSGPTSWLVWPHILELDALSPLTAGDGDDDLVSTHPVPSGYSSSSVREYVAGDDVRHVHWPATARHGQLMVRQFDPPARQLIRIIVAGDVQEPGVDDAWETMISLAASTVVHFHQLGIPTELCLNDLQLTTPEASLDALAEVGRCPDPRAPRIDVPTVLFQHTSAQPYAHGPASRASAALVTGPNSADVRRALIEMNWASVSAPTDPARDLPALLKNLRFAR